MKKMISIAMILGMLLLHTTAGFAQTGTEEPAAGREDAQQQTQLPEDEEFLAPQMFYGKVKQVIGNEITLRLAEIPGMEPTDEGGGTAAEEELPMGGAGEVVAAAVTAVAASSAPGEDADHLELTYLDEEMSFILPAGIPIYDQTTGQEVQLSALKKGTVLMVAVQQETGAVEEIVIWEHA